MLGQTLKRHRNALLIILWGVLFAKCFALEYLVQAYSIPINSTIYIWSLSIFMASAATIVFLRLVQTESDTSSPDLPTAVTWIGCIVAMLIATAAGFSLESLPPLRIPAYLALLLGIAYCAHALINKNQAYAFSGLGWWIGSAILFRATSINNLRIFALFIILCTVLPTIVLMIRRQWEIEHKAGTVGNT